MDKLKEVSALALKMLLESGAEDAAVSAGESVVNEFNLAEGEFTLFRTLESNSLSLTAYVGGKKGNLSINSFAEEAIKQAVSDCLQVAQAGVADEAWGLNPKAEETGFDRGCRTPDTELFFERCKEFKESVAKGFPHVLTTEIISQHRGGRTVYRNSKGACLQSEGGAYSLFTDFAGNDGENTSSFFYTGLVTTDLSTPFLDQQTLRRDHAAAEKSIITTPVEGKFTGTIVMEPGCAGDFIFSALELFTSDSSIIDGTSIWKDKLGTKVAADMLTVSAAPLDERIIGGERWTGEGFISEDYDVIKDGVLNSFMLSLYAANKTGLKRSPNSAGVTVIKPGDKSLEEIIKGVKNGLLVGRFSGGAPSSNGDFSGVAKNSFRIEDGKITDAVSETMISGNLADLLLNISAISAETTTGESVIPWIAAEGVLISGK